MSINVVNEHKGHCVCGLVKILFSSPKEIATYSPRKCDCQYCMTRGIEYLSDPEAKITVISHLPLRQETQGSEQARFLLCARCQTMVAVGYLNKGFWLGSINATLLDEYDKLQNRVVISPKVLDRTDKVSRWGELWSEMVVVEDGGEV